MELELYKNKIDEQIREAKEPFHWDCIYLANMTEVEAWCQNKADILKDRPWD